MFIHETWQENSEKLVSDKHTHCQEFWNVISGSCAKVISGVIMFEEWEFLECCVRKWAKYYNIYMLCILISI